MSATDNPGDLATGGRCSSLVGAPAWSQHQDMEICKTVAFNHRRRTRSRRISGDSRDSPLQKDDIAFQSLTLSVARPRSRVHGNFDGDGTTRAAGRRRRCFDKDGGCCCEVSGVSGCRRRSDSGGCWYWSARNPGSQRHSRFLTFLTQPIFDKCFGMHRYAVVTGANKGIGFETVRQLSSQGVTVILTARDEKRGRAATSSLHRLGLSDRVVFHQLDVLDPLSVQALADFVRDKFGRLDILVNNAGASGVVVDEDALRALNIDPADWLAGKVTNLVQGVIKQTYEKGEECLNTNYYGVKRVTEALLPLLQLSPGGARIVNVSSLRSELRRIPNESIRNELGEIETLTEEKVEVILRRFLKDLKENALEAKGWQMMLPAYSISKVTLNAYTRILAKKYPNMYINCVHPGYVNTDLNWHTGPLTVEDGASGPLMLALLPDGGPTGRYFDQTQVAEF